MRLLRYLFSLLCLSVFSFHALGQGYEIKVKINGLAEKPLILGHYMSKSMFPDDTIKLDSKGFGIFKGTKKLPEGMYIIYLPNTSYFDVIVGADQFFTLETDTVEYIKNLVVHGSEDNQLFLDFQKFMERLRDKGDSLTNLIKLETEPKAKELLTTKLRKVGEERANKIRTIKQEHPNLFLSDFLLATLDIAVPDPPKDENGVVIDSSWQYYYYRHHYFDNFDVSDPRLLRTPFYEDKIMTYLTKVVPQIPDSLIPQVDYFIEKSKVDSGLFRFMLITLFTYYTKSNIMGMDALYVHIADKYYIHDSWWSDPKYIGELRDHVAKTKPLLIGAVSPDAELMLVPPEHFKSAKTDTSLRSFPHVGTKSNLRQIEAKFLVLFFWEADCGHCKKAVPQLYKIYEEKLKSMGVKVLAISTLFGEDGKVKWVDFVNEHGLYDWINAWNPYSYDFKLKYDIVTTPQIFILDANKRILAKKIAPEQVEEIINTLNKR
jgi:thiol-disulfide isomerase/thioredoxin